MIRVPLAALAMAVSAAGAFAQTAAAPPAFDVATVRPSAGGGQRRGGGGLGGIPGLGGGGNQNIQIAPATLTMRGATLKSCVRWAYKVTEFQVTGPDWIDTDRFDIVGKAAGPVSEDTLRLMLRSLLAERFQLTFHRQSKELQTYVLIPGKGGTKLRESQEAGEGSIQADQTRLTVAVQKTPISQLVDLLSGLLRAPVIDETGLKGRYDITINIAKYLAERQNADAILDPISLVTTALQEELGLKLESRKTAMEMLTIDHAEKTPVEN